MNVILICQRRPKVFEFCHIFKQFISYTEPSFTPIQNNECFVTFWYAKRLWMRISSRRTWLVTCPSCMSFAPPPQQRPPSSALLRPDICCYSNSWRLVSGSTAEQSKAGGALSLPTSSSYKAQNWSIFPTHPAAPCPGLFFFFFLFL
jgi:hypothetical protein